MNYNKGEIDTEIRRTNNKEQLGCLFWLIILISIPSYYVGKYIYKIEFKEYPLLVSYSPEALARAYAVKCKHLNRDENDELGRHTAKLVEKESDRIWLVKNLKTVTSLSLPEW